MHNSTRPASDSETLHEEPQLGATRRLSAAQLHLAHKWARPCSLSSQLLPVCFTEPRGGVRLLQRYISDMPLWRHGPELAGKQGPAEAGDPSASRAALAPLADLCKRAQAEVAREVAIMEQIFPDPGAALAELVHWLFEMRISVGLPGPATDPAVT